MEPNENNIIEKDELTGDKLLSGHEYDGIKELDNKLPKWWLWLFYITIIFAAVYFTRMHIIQTADKQDDAYKKEVEAAMLKYKDVRQANMIDASTVVQLSDADALAAGKAIFEKSCIACHLAQGQGLVGPNLTDDYWIHGCTIADIFRTITTGVPDKGMISWKDQLNPQQIQQVASYVMSLHGTNPPNPKAPQGDICK
jgi:cytochrome c oxidase cbb3-type subunit III